MNNENMAKFIFELRKSKNMTQRQLAEKLNITDKAVSKWERGLGYPDISILPNLAEALGVTANELLNGKRSQEQSPAENSVVETTLEYANKVTVSKKESVLYISKLIFTVFCFIGIFVCIICNMAISGKLTWALYPIISIIYGWLIIIPLLHFKKNKVLISLILFSIFTIPFFIILNKIIGGIRLMLPLGVPISIISIVYLWIVYILISIKNTSKCNMIGVSVLLGIPVSILINYIIAKYIKQPIIDVWDVLTFGIMITVSIILFFIGKRKKEE